MGVVLQEGIRMGPPDGMLMGKVTVEWLYEGADGRKGTHRFRCSNYNH